MKTKASVLTIRVPFELKHKIERIAEEQGISINQLALYAFTKELAEMETNEYFLKYWRNYKKENIIKDFDSVIKKVSRKKVPAWDNL
jgi:FAD synthase